MTPKKPTGTILPVGDGYQALALPDRWQLTDDQMQVRSEDFLALMKTRHSIRDFSPRSVPRKIIETCLETAGLAPSGANHQPWHFAVIETPAAKAQVRAAAEEEERNFYAGRAGDEWLAALEPIGTDDSKPFLDIAPYLIVIFAQRYGINSKGERYKNYYVPESVGIATGLLITALHNAGLVTLTHTPNPMKFLNELCGRPASEKPEMILVVGHPTDSATVPAHAKWKKPLEEIVSFI
ncbi:MAG: nitroreductase family protein [Alphaproteobacteria bacterium]|nr:MAG: nitroreductase family protein [Alphaproteobacteria bacterium]